MRPFWHKVAAVGFLVFVALWVAGFGRTFFVPYQPRPTFELPSGPSYRLVDASRLPQANNLAQIGLAHMPLPLVLEQAEVERIQVYEKNAQLETATTAFDDDEALVRSALAAQQARVFYETSGGLTPERRLSLEIGVQPEKFEALVSRLQQIGHVQSVVIQQRDRTSEFRHLHAKRQSLKKHLEAVMKLRQANNPSIEDALRLEQKIQDIEKELQALTVQFGDLVGKESYYHIQLQLVEHVPGSRVERAYTLASRVWHGFVWAAGWWVAAAAASGVLAGTYLSIQTLRSKPWLPAGRSAETPAS